MSTAILGIGSNVADAAYRIRKSLDLLVDSGCCVFCESEIYQVSMPYLNLVAAVSTPMEYADFLHLTKHLESLLGRMPHRKGDKVVPVDIDIVVFDHVTLRPVDFNAPYFTIGYESIAPFLSKMCADQQA